MSATASVTCPQCGSLVPLGDRKCDNCGARQKDFAPAPMSYTRPAEPAAPPVVAPAREAPAAVHTAVPAVASAPAAPLAYRAPGSASEPAPGAHAVGVPPRRSGQGPVSPAPVPRPGMLGSSSPVSAYAAAKAPVRSRAASRALVFALVPVAVNVLGFILLMILVLTDVYTGEGAGEVLFGLLVILFLLVGGIGSLVLFVLALVNGIRGVRETAGRALPGRGRAVWALVIVGAHVLIVAGNILIGIVGAIAGS